MTPKIVVITMVQARDFPSAWSSLRPLTAQLSAQRQRIVLLNDVRDEALEGALEALPHTTVLTPGSNLGVALGRNALFAAALETGAESVVVLDDDLYVPADYLDIVERTITSAGPDLGIFAPTVLRFGAFVDANPDIIDCSVAVDGELDHVVLSDVLRTGIDASDVGMFYHLGVRDWQEHFLSPSSVQGRQVARLLSEAGIIRGRPERKVTWLRNDEESRSTAAFGGGLQFVDTVAGGVSVFSAEMLRSIGVCDERFSPFGYEDSDLCIRALKSGYRVAWIPEIVILHDFLDRGDSRSAEHLNLIAGRSRALLGANHLQDSDLGGQMAMAFSAYLADAVGVSRHRNSNKPQPEQVLASVAAFAIGYLGGAVSSQIGQPTLLDRFASQSGGLSLETRTGRRWIIDRLPTFNSPAAPMLTADIVSEGADTIETTAHLELRFPDGLRIEHQISFTHDASSLRETAQIRHLSFEGHDSGVTVRRLLGTLMRARGVIGSSALVDQLLPLDTTPQALLRRLFSPNGRSRSVAARMKPSPPVRLDDLVTTSLATATGITRLGLSVTARNDHR